MNISMWNLYHFLPYSNMLPMINSSEATITAVRWISSEYLRPDTVYVGQAMSFFATDDQTAIIVSRRDMILISDTDPEDVFNEVCHVMENLNNWETELKSYISQENGLQKMLDCSRKILENPAYIYGPDGAILAITDDDKNIHWVWKEIVEDQGISPERMKYLKETIHLSEVFKDTRPTRRNSKMSSYEYIHCSLFANGYMAGHFVLFGMLQEIPQGFEDLLVNLMEQMDHYITVHFDSYSPSSRVENLARNILSEPESPEGDYHEIMRAMCWEPDQEFRLFLIAEKSNFSVNDTPVMLERLNSQIRQEFPYLLVFRIRNMLAAIEYRHALSVHEQENFLLRLLEEDFICGISSPYDNIHQSHLYYAQAREELQICSEKNISVCDAEKGGEDHLLRILVQDTTGICYINPHLLKLKNYDEAHRTDYLLTLKTWCMCCCHLSATARRLYVHRNTISYRLEKIQELIPLDYFERIIAEGSQTETDQLFYSFMILTK